MFLIRNRAVFWSVRRTRDLFNSIKGQPQKQPPTQSGPVKEETKHADSKQYTPKKQVDIKFPYKFGGVTKKYPIIDVPHPVIPPKSELIKIYIEFLRAIQKQDEKKLITLVEPSLVKPLLLQNFKIKLIQNSINGTLEMNTINHGVGVKFNREDNKHFKTISQSIPFSFNQWITDSNMKAYMRQDFNLFQYMNQGIPILFSLDTTIWSNTRLVQDNGDENKLEQAHYVTFENEKLLNIMKVMSLFRQGRLFQKGNSFNDIPKDIQKQVRQIMQSLLNSNQNKWKIGNIDHFLPSRWSQ